MSQSADTPQQQVSRRYIAFTPYPWVNNDLNGLLDLLYDPACKVDPVEILHHLGIIINGLDFLHRICPPGLDDPSKIFPEIFSEKATPEVVASPEASIMKRMPITTSMLQILEECGFDGFVATNPVISENATAEVVTSPEASFMKGLPITTSMLQILEEYGFDGFVATNPVISENATAEVVASPEASFMKGLPITTSMLQILEGSGWDNLVATNPVISDSMRSLEAKIVELDSMLQANVEPKEPKAPRFVKRKLESARNRPDRKPKRLGPTGTWVNESGDEDGSQSRTIIAEQKTETSLRRQDTLTD